MPSLIHTWFLLLSAVTFAAAWDGLVGFRDELFYGIAIDPNSPLQNGTPVRLGHFDGKDQAPVSARLWTLNRGPTKVKLSQNPEFCLDAGTNPTNGTLMKVWQCYDNLPAQAWYWTDDNRIALEGQGFCLDLPNGSIYSQPPQQLQIWACGTGNTNQIWKEDTI
ncbi:ricin B lectin domain-containing protein [Ephemerocybe angulata]|uniref:Ricin B lectin domain-containing protein n=1 Tax=Ephemerocybe angulata TaxID=980116 RepID=A0A8H6IEQ8_9AGAR|nr:ricin B lectin domain-containing protein [Tulosesus angulatus]